jgi:hypothetical protein
MLGVMLIFMAWLLAALLAAYPTRAQQGYPAAGIANLRTTCMQRKDLPASAMNAYCDCYVDLMQKNVPWHDFLLLDSAISVKGTASLDAEEKTILGKALETTFYCSQKIVR